jgi:hypothetical protein
MYSLNAEFTEAFGENRRLPFEIKKDYLNKALAHHNTGACPCISPTIRLRSR